MGSVVGPSEFSKNFTFLDIGLGDNPFVAIMPILYVSKVNIPEDIYIYAFIIPITVMFILYLARLLKIYEEFWSIFTYYRLCLEYP